MAAGGRRAARFRPERIGDFLDAVYCLDTDDQTWLAEVMARGRAVWGRGGPAHGIIYDASDVSAFAMHETHTIDFTNERLRALHDAAALVTPAYVSRSFRTLLTHHSCRHMSSPELLPFLDRMGELGTSDFLGVNGLDPEGRGVILGYWMSAPLRPERAEAMAYRRMAHHLGAGHRCRRRLRQAQAQRLATDATDGAEAILDSRRRIVHADGPAKDRQAQAALIEMSVARDGARRAASSAPEALGRWRPLTGARWTLVDSFERGGARYIVARENQSRVHGMDMLSDRERQVIAYLAIGQSTKETAYALGIADTTVRVLVSRAAAKLGVRARSEILAHPAVQALRGGRPGR